MTSSQPTIDRLLPGTFTLILDPGHAWLEVPFNVVRALGLADSFSGFSYIDSPVDPLSRNAVRSYYLEEDCDMPIFLLRYLERTGHSAKIRQNYLRRDFPRRGKLRLDEGAYFRIEMDRLKRWYERDTRPALVATA